MRHPHILLLFKGVPRCGTVPAEIVEHMLLQYDQRFAADTNFVFNLFNL